MLQSDIGSARNRKHTDDKQNNPALAARSKINPKSSKSDSVVGNRNKPIGAEKKAVKKVVGSSKTSDVKYRNSSNHTVAKKDNLPHHKASKEESGSKLPKLDSYQSLLQYAKEQQANTEKSAENTTKNLNTNYRNTAKPQLDTRQSSSMQRNVNDNLQQRNVKRLKRIADNTTETVDRSTLKGQPAKAARASNGNESHEIKREALPHKYRDEREKARNHLNKSREMADASDRKIKSRPSSTVLPNRNIARAPRTGTLLFNSFLISL